MRERREREEEQYCRQKRELQWEERSMQQEREREREREDVKFILSVVSMVRLKQDREQQLKTNKKSEKIEITERTGIMRKDVSSVVLKISFVVWVRFVVDRHIRYCLHTTNSM